MFPYNLKAWILIALSTGLACAMSVQADNLNRPFTVQNQHPFVNLFGLTRVTDARILADERTIAYASYSVASHFEVGRNASEQIVIDGESERLDFTVRHGLAPHWEIGANVPFVRHSGGYLDNLIIDWHDLFDLPQNGRDLAPDDRIAIGYVGPLGQVGVFDDVSGIGDVQIFAARELGPTTALRGHIKVPTGDADELLGSGGVDVGVSLGHEGSISERWLWGANVGVNFLSDADVLGDHVRPVVGQFGARVAYQPTDWLSLKVQWDAHSQLYEDTRLRQLNEIAYVLSFGGTMRIARNGVLDLVVTENYPHPEITPDVAFVVGLNWSLGGTAPFR